jgi:hypothetical protein
MHESAEDLAALEDLLDASYAAAGAHLRSIITPQRRVDVEELVERLRGMCLLVLATVTADGRPIVGPVDGVFHRGSFHFGSSPQSLRFRHLRVRPGVSATHAPSEAFAVTVHGRATMVPISGGDGAGLRRTLLEVYTPRLAVGGIPGLRSGLRPDRRRAHVHVAPGGGGIAAGARLDLVQEILPGVWHWRARHEHIDMAVSSYYLPAERVAIDTLIPDEGLGWFEKHGVPEHVLLTNRHHDRHAWKLHDAFGTTVHCVRCGLHELAGRGPVEAFDFGDELPGGVVVHEVDAICPDETALHIPAHRALACADGIVRWHETDPLGFVPDWLMDNPPETKAGLVDAYRRLLALDFDTLLLAHGEPIVGRGKQLLREFLDDAAA